MATSGNNLFRPQKIPIFPAGEKHFVSEVAIAQRFSFREYPKRATS